MKEARKKNEKQFFDQTFECEARKPVSKFYSIVNNSREFYEKFLLSHSSYKKVLEYGCGTGSHAFFLAKHSAEVVGIDISEVAIKMAEARAKEEGLKNITFLVNDAEAMQFEESTFDIVCGTGILHHLHIDKALKEITKVLKPDGRAIFLEPMGHNPLINLFRKLTPQFRTKDEHPLKNKDLELIKEFFHKTDYSFFNLFTLLAVPFHTTRVFSSLHKMLDNLDKKLFDWVPLVKLLAWQVMIILEKPNKSISSEIPPHQSCRASKW